jgi:hypothetical protein
MENWPILFLEWINMVPNTFNKPLKMTFLQRLLLFAGDKCSIFARFFKESL